MVYEPPTNLTPGQAGFMWRQGGHHHQVVAELLELARRKMVSIKRIEVSRLLGTKADYLLTDISANRNITTLSPVQNYLHRQLFKSGSNIKLSDLKGSFHTQMQHAQKLIIESIMQLKTYRQIPSTTQATAILAGLGMLMLTFFLIIITLSGTNVWWPFLA